MSLTGYIQKTRTNPQPVAPAPVAPTKPVVQEAPVNQGKFAVAGNLGNKFFSVLTSPFRWGPVKYAVNTGVGLVTTGAQAAGESIGAVVKGEGIRGVGRAIQRAGETQRQIVAGQKTQTFFDVFTDPVGAKYIHPKLRPFVGLSADILLDPLTYAGAGAATAEGKVAKAATSATKEIAIARKAAKTPEELAKVAQLEEVYKSSRLAQRVQKLGITEEFGVTGAQQLQRGQRAGVTFLGKSLTGKNFDKALGRWVEVFGKRRTAVLDALEKTGGKTGMYVNTVRELFKTKSASPEVNRLLQKKVNMETAQLHDLEQRAANAQTLFSKLSQTNKDAVVRAMAEPKYATYLDTASREVYDRLDMFRYHLTTWRRSLGDLKELKTDEFLPLVQQRKAETGLFDQVYGRGGALTEKETTRAGRGFYRLVPEQNVSGKAETFIDNIHQKRYEDIGNGAVKDTITGDTYRIESADPIRVNERIKELNVNRATNDQIQLFEENPVVALYRRGADVIRAKNLKEFTDELRTFGKPYADAPKDWMTISIRGFDDVRFAPEVAKHLDALYKGMAASNQAVALRLAKYFTGIWKSNALLSPTYHIRNAVGNLWNNFLAGVVDPTLYKLAQDVQLGKEIKPFVDDAGRVWTTEKIYAAAKENGVLNLGQFTKDLETEVERATSKNPLVSGAQRYNPTSRKFIAYEMNQHIGQSLENNARLTNFIFQLKKGVSASDAALSVKRYLFDYGELSPFERDALKTIMPFYTFTRKNVPLQFKELYMQPGKFAGFEKVRRFAENFSGEKPDERFLQEYIKNNTPLRIRTKDGVTQYLILGYWVPAAQALNFLSQPRENVISMLSPYIKVPFELLSNTSTFFRDQFGRPSQIESSPGQTGNFMGLTLRKKSIHLLQNIRILRELDNLNPGEIFGDRSKLPGTSATSKYKLPEFNRFINFMVGSVSQYNPREQQGFYNLAQKRLIQDYNASIKNELRKGKKASAQNLQKELRKKLREALDKQK